MICLLCNNQDTAEFCKDSKRIYYRCPVCQLIFVPPVFHLAEIAEKAEYDLHQNNPEDLQYRKFLNRIFQPLKEKLTPGSIGLDFGSGPGPTLSVMFKELGYRVKLYDKFYSPDDSVFRQQFDFITATEVVEHLRNPQSDLQRLWDCLKPGGWLGFMTKLALGTEEFKKWHYKNDMTHICFFSEDTFKWLADQWQAELVFADKDVILLKK